MAKIEVSGTVASVNGTGSGFRVEEGIEIDGKWYRRFYSAWFPRTATVQVPNPGDKVTVVGSLSAKVSPRDARFVDFTINNARITERSTAQDTTVQPSDTQDTPPEDPWATPEPAWAVATVPDDEEPF